MKKHPVLVLFPLVTLLLLCSPLTALSEELPNQHPQQQIFRDEYQSRETFRVSSDAKSVSLQKNQFTLIPSPRTSGQDSEEAEELSDRDKARKLLALLALSALRGPKTLGD